MPGPDYGIPSSALVGRVFDAANRSDPLLAHIRRFTRVNPALIQPGANRPAASSDAPAVRDTRTPLRSQYALKVASALADDAGGPAWFFDESRALHRRQLSLVSAERLALCRRAGLKNDEHLLPESYFCFWPPAIARPVCDTGLSSTEKENSVNFQMMSVERANLLMSYLIPPEVQWSDFARTEREIRRIVDENARQARTSVGARDRSVQAAISTNIRKARIRRATEKCEELRRSLTHPDAEDSDLDCWSEVEFECPEVEAEEKAGADDESAAPPPGIPPSSASALRSAAEREKAEIRRRAQFFKIFANRSTFKGAVGGEAEIARSAHRLVPAHRVPLAFPNPLNGVGCSLETPVVAAGWVRVNWKAFEGTLAFFELRPHAFLLYAPRGAATTEFLRLHRANEVPDLEDLPFPTRQTELQLMDGIRLGGPIATTRVRLHEAGASTSVGPNQSGNGLQPPRPALDNSAGGFFLFSEMRNSSAGFHASQAWSLPNQVHCELAGPLLSSDRVATLLLQGKSEVATTRIWADTTRAHAVAASDTQWTTSFAPSHPPSQQHRGKLAPASPAPSAAAKPPPAGAGPLLPTWEARLAFFDAVARETRKSATCSLALGTVSSVAAGLALWRGLAEEKGSKGVLAALDLSDSPSFVQELERATRSLIRRRSSIVRRSGSATSGANGIASQGPAHALSDMVCLVATRVSLIEDFDKFVHILGTELCGLQRLNLDYAQLPPEDGIERLLQTCAARLPKLCVLSLIGVTSDNSTIVGALKSIKNAPYCPSFIYVNDNGPLDEESIRSVLRELPRIARIIFSGESTKKITASVVNPQLCFAPNGRSTRAHILDAMWHNVLSNPYSQVMDLSFTKLESPLDMVDVLKQVLRTQSCLSLNLSWVGGTVVFPRSTRLADYASRPYKILSRLRQSGVAPWMPPGPEASGPARPTVVALFLQGTAFVRSGAHAGADAAALVNFIRETQVTHLDLSYSPSFSVLGSSRSAALIAELATACGLSELSVEHASLGAEAALALAKALAGGPRRGFPRLTALRLAGNPVDAAAALSLLRALAPRGADDEVFPLARVDLRGCEGLDPEKVAQFVRKHRSWRRCAACIQAGPLPEPAAELHAALAALAARKPWAADAAQSLLGAAIELYRFVEMRRGAGDAAEGGGREDETATAAQPRSPALEAAVPTLPVDEVLGKIGRSTLRFAAAVRGEGGDPRAALEKYKNARIANLEALREALGAEPQRPPGTQAETPPGQPSEGARAPPLSPAPDFFDDPTVTVVRWRAATPFSIDAFNDLMHEARLAPHSDPRKFDFDALVLACCDMLDADVGELRDWFLRRGRGDNVPSIRRLDLSHNRLGPGALTAIADLASCCRLKTLVLDGNPLFPSDVAVPAEAIRSIFFGCPTLRTLSIRGTCVGDGGSFMASLDVERQCMLQRVCMQHNIGLSVAQTKLVGQAVARDNAHASVVVEAGGCGAGGPPPGEGSEDGSASSFLEIDYTPLYA